MRKRKGKFSQVVTTRNVIWFCTCKACKTTVPVLNENKPTEEGICCSVKCTNTPQRFTIYTAQEWRQLLGIR